MDAAGAPCAAEDTAKVTVIAHADAAPMMTQSSFRIGGNARVLQLRFGCGLGVRFQNSGVAGGVEQPVAVGDFRICRARRLMVS